MIDIMDTTTDKCHLCNNIAEYDDIAKVEGDDYIVSGVCKEHLKMGLSG
jgi:hypothetical protein